MSLEEVNSIILSNNQLYKDRWEMTRYIAYVVAACNSSKIKAPQDLLKFSWEKEIEEENKLTKEQRQEKEKAMVEWLNHKSKTK